MSVFSYNGVIFPYAFTTKFDQEAVYDDVGKTDWCYMKVDMIVRTVVDVAYLPIIAPDLLNTTTSPATIMTLIRQRLLRPRRHISLTMDGIELLPKHRLAPDGLPVILGTVDAKNGPQPQSCSITQLTDRSFLLDYHVIAHYFERDNPDSSGSGGLNTNRQTGNAVLYNRWTDSIDIDSLNFSSRTREGKFVIRSDAEAAITVDQLRRQMAHLAIPRGFVRDSSHYSVSPDGLGLSYRITDREVYRVPPSSAATSDASNSGVPGQSFALGSFKADGDYAETVPMGGCYKIHEVRVSLMGTNVSPVSKDIYQGYLFTKAHSICLMKLNANGVPLNSRRGVILNAYARFKMYDCAVECFYRVQSMGDPKTGNINLKFRRNKLLDFSTSAQKSHVPYPVDTGSPSVLIDGTGIDGQNMGTIKSSPTTDPPKAYLYGSTVANMLLQAAAYYDPALRNTLLDSRRMQLSTGLMPGQAGVFPEV